MSTKILVLENTEGISELLTISLSTDYDVISASSVDHALTLMVEQNPPLVVFDVTIPGVDGIEFLCKIKKQSPNTEVIIITDPENRELGTNCLKYEASDFILKPVKSESLEIALERALKKLAIKKRLNPNSGEFFPSVVDSERVALTKQLINILAASRISSGESDLSVTSGIISIHTRKGIILGSSEEFKKRFGNMDGKKSWEIYRKGSVTPESCPAAQAYKTQDAYVLKSAILSLKHGGEIMAHVYAAPLFNQNDETDLVVEIINI